MDKKIKIFITYDKGATINRIFAYANVLSNYYQIEIVILSTQENEQHSKMLNSNVKISYVLWDGNVSTNFFARFIQEYNLVRSLSKKLNGNEDTIFVSIPFFALLFLPFFKKNKSHKVLDIRDLNWEYLPSSNPILRSAKAAMSYIAKKFISKYDQVIVTNKYEQRWVEKASKKLPLLIHNGISREQFSKLTGNQISIKGGEKIHISYIGNVGIAQNLLSFIKVIKDYPKFELQIIGDGNDYERITEFLEKNAITNVKMIGRVSLEEVPEFYLKADILFAKLDPNYKTAVPSKLFEMLTTNKPLIYSGEGAAIEVLKKFDNIYYYNTKDALIEILEKIQHIELNLSLNNRKKVSDNFIREVMVENNLKVFTV